MNVFGEDYVSHNLPLIFVSGLREDTGSTRHTARQPQEGGFRIRTDLPAIETALAESVSKAIYRFDGSEAPWRTVSPPTKLFAVRNVGRVGSTLCHVVRMWSNRHAVVHASSSQSASSAAFTSPDQHRAWSAAFAGPALPVVSSDADLATIP
jgi:hypothetical protein